MRLHLYVTFFAILLCFGARNSFAEQSTAAARGGINFAYHFNSLAAFDAELAGTPFVVGGEGFATVFKNFRVGGGGGGGFVWTTSDNIMFGMGYGGVLGEYTPAPWLAIRLLIGGGGYAVAKVTTDSINTQTISKLSAGGFILFYPSVRFEIPLSAIVKISVNVGYFVPNKAQLRSVTMGISLLFGKHS
jgi:hypothetical protein